LAHEDAAALAGALFSPLLRVCLRRDKIAGSKKKGIWVGGVVPLGYELKERKLLIDEEEAKIVRLVFERYLALPR
jgi:hypothetical protein